MRNQNKNKKQCWTTILKEKKNLIHINFLNRDANYQCKKQNITKIKIRIKSETSKHNKKN
jgi:hypothetical protein